MWRMLEKYFTARSVHVFGFYSPVILVYCSSIRATPSVLGVHSPVGCLIDVYTVS